MRLTEAQVQEEQRKRYQDWVKSEGGVERAVLDETYKEPAQVQRTKWLIDQVQDLPIVNAHRSILELGCSGGHQLLAMQGLAGVDINTVTIDTNRKAHPDNLWIHANITEPGWDIMLLYFDCVVLPEILEHLEWHQVKTVIRKAKQLAKRRVLVTVPDGRVYGENRREVNCFKHKFVVSEPKFHEIAGALRDGGWNLQVDTVGAFICMRADKK